MPHSPELIQQILRIVEIDYPSSDYAYHIEQSIAGTRMFPDIAISDPKTRKICCAIEIGYTRPEKLTAYRQSLGIPDVRWYDKKGNLHTKVLDVETVKVNTTIEPGQLFSVYLLQHAVECCADDCYCQDEMEGLGIDVDSEEDFQYRRLDVITVAITDGYHAWLPSFCDKCGTVFLADEEGGWAVLADLELSPREFARIHGRRALHDGWSKAVEFAQSHLPPIKEPIEYFNGIALRGAEGLRLNVPLLIRKAAGA